MTSWLEANDYMSERDDDPPVDVAAMEKRIRELECRVEALEDGLQGIIDVCTKGVPVTFMVDLGKAVEKAIPLLYADKPKR
jgi:hypothetical protein